MESTLSNSMLAPVDVAIVAGFLLVVTVVGWVLSRVASQGLESYFLGGRKIPWWVLGISTSTSNFDMSGTMIIVAVVFALGYKGFLVEMRGGVGLSLAFLLVFLGKWLRRSRVMTSAEWMKIRFGTDRQGRLAHQVSALANLALSLGMIVYFAKGSGKFLTEFLPFSEMTCTSVMVGVGLFYTLLSGLYGVVFTDVIQMILLTFTAIWITIKGFAIRPEVTLPQGFFDLNLDTPATGAALLAQDPAAWEPIFGLFGLAVMMWVLRTALEGMSGVGGYTDQRFFAARTEREASLLTLEAVVLSVFRWTMVAALVVLGYHMVQSGAGAAIAGDPEKVLPVVLGNTLAPGIRGIVVAGLIAAAMSTFDSTLNAGAAYLVRDIYQTYIRPDASPKRLMRASHLATAGLCVAGVGLAALVPNINEIWAFITMGLGAGLFVPLFLRWYWPRFNGYGFAIGTGVGAVAGLGISGLLAAPLYLAFPSVVLIALTGSVLGSLFTAPTSDGLLTRFCVQINPGGLWGRFRAKAVEDGLLTQEQDYARFSERINDLIAVFFSVPMQASLLLAGMSFVFHDWMKFSFFVVTGSLSAVGLYFFWYRNLKSSEQSLAEEQLLEAEEALAPARATARAGSDVATV